MVTYMNLAEGRPTNRYNLTQKGAFETRQLLVPEPQIPVVYRWPNSHAAELCLCVYTGCLGSSQPNTNKVSNVNINKFKLRNNTHRHCNTMQLRSALLEGRAYVISTYPLLHCRRKASRLGSHNSSRKAATSERLDIHFPTLVLCMGEINSFTCLPKTRTSRLTGVGLLATPRYRSRKKDASGNAP